ncbi:Siroheme biosynthesis protein met8 [Cyberlindnera fabianii]|uniref:precorrin-2 dehydrogenase n=1 Tax=Cyberlindnera fabianii TaxID=36022 RepID=A0A1V2L716_CYBFA|nr:Siroheme biosynthesis protein met8 [Cyberlindnera fabianii]
MSTSFPQILPNGSLILAWQVKTGRIYHLLNANAKVTVISPSMNAEIEQREKDGLLHAVVRRAFVEDDLEMYSKGKEAPVLTEYNEEEYALMDQYIKETSTNGKGPRMARLIKDKIGDMFADYEIDKTVENIGQVRKLLRKACPGQELNDISTRMEWMTKVTDIYSFKQWSVMDPEEVIKYFPEMPPKFEEL